MRSFRTRCSAVAAWVMIPLAAWAGAPSTACVCANGRVKLFCSHGTPPAKTGVHDDTHCESDCCGESCGEIESSDDSDCCGKGACCHGAKSSEPGIASKACCRPILTPPSIAPKAAKAPDDQTLCVVAVVELGSSLTPTSSSYDRALFASDTGPPLDRVILFRSLLI